MLVFASLTFSPKKNIKQDCRDIMCDFPYFETVMAGIHKMHWI